MRILYLILICFAAPVAAALAWWRGQRDPARRERIADRFGRPRNVRTGGIWVHAASMGEVQIGAALVRGLLESGEHITLTTMTTTGAARVASLFAAEPRVRHCYLPYDIPWAVRGFLDRTQPKRAVILETELWPEILRRCERRNIPVAVVNARISARTAQRYRRFAGLFRGAMRNVTVAAQSQADADRFAVLEPKQILIVGNLKFDIDIPDAVVAAGQVLRARLTPRMVWVAGSTHDGEEAAALAAHREVRKRFPDALLILVPRHPQRFEAVRALLRRQECNFVAHSTGEPLSIATEVLLVDTMGELLACYAAADLAFVGGSLIPLGGHNLLEPAALGVATLCGPHMQNAADVFESLQFAGAVQCVENDTQLATEVLRLLSDQQRRSAMATAARRVVEENRGALARTLALLRAND